AEWLGGPAAGIDGVEVGGNWRRGASAHPLPRRSFRCVSAKLRLCALEAREGFHVRPPLGESVDIENGVLVRRQGDIEHDRCEIEVRETQVSGDEGRRA